jgi:hypothetical protein
MATAQPRPDLPVEGKTVRAMVSLLAKRGHAEFQAGVLNKEDEDAVIRSRCARRWTMARSASHVRLMSLQHTDLA